MTPNTDPIQAVEQEIEDVSTEIILDINAVVPTTATVSEDMIRNLAGDVWLANGGIPDDPRTLDNWLFAEAELLANVQPAQNG